MATYTSHYNLKKPASSDVYSISDMNGNSDTIDTTMYNTATAVSTAKKKQNVVLTNCVMGSKASSSKYSGYGYRYSYSIPSNKVDSAYNYVPIVTLGLTDALGGKICPIADYDYNSGSPKVYIYSKDSVTSYTALTITLVGMDAST